MDFSPFLKPPPIKPSVGGAAEPAALTLSKSVLYRHVGFRVTFSASEQWLQENDIRPDEILYAGLRVRVLRATTLEDVRDCPRCSRGKPVIELGVEDNARFLAGRAENGRREFVFDRCRTNGTSSRNHLKDQLVLALDLTPTVTVLSPAFCMRARMVAQRRTALGAEVAGLRLGGGVDALGSAL